MTATSGGDEGGTRTAVLVLRLWAEPHDERVRGRLLAETSEEGVLAVGVEAILATVEAQLRRFAGADGRPTVS